MELHRKKLKKNVSRGINRNLFNKLMLMRQQTALAMSQITYTKRWQSCPVVRHWS